MSKALTIISAASVPVGAVLPQASSSPGTGGPALSLNGKVFRIASIKDEEWIDNPVLNNLDAFISRARTTLRADLFTFVEPIGTTRPRFPKYHLLWDNAAAVPITTFQDWWEKRVPQETRKNVRRSQRRGVTVRTAVFDDAFVRGIKRIYDEVPFRQGRRFWHYGKDLATIKRENSSYLERSEFIGAYFGEELIGFVKIVYVGDVARIMQILSMNEHFDKRPANALLAKAIERSCERNVKFFLYGKYVYGNKRSSPVTEFKRRNGFEELPIPRYYVPLTSKGEMALALGLHAGIRDLLPEPITEFFLKLRAQFYARTHWVSGTT